MGVDRQEFACVHHTDQVGRIRRHVSPPQDPGRNRRECCHETLAPVRGLDEPEPGVSGARRHRAQGVQRATEIGNEMHDRWEVRNLPLVMPRAVGIDKHEHLLNRSRRRLVETCSGRNDRPSQIVDRIIGQVRRDANTRKGLGLEGVGQRRQLEAPRTVPEQGIPARPPSFTRDHFHLVMAIDLPHACSGSQPRAGV